VATSLFWPRDHERIAPLVSAVELSAKAFAADYAKLATGGYFTGMYPGLAASGEWEQVTLYNGDMGWSEQLCAVASATCDMLRGRLPGEHLREFYFLSNTEEVAFVRLAAGTHLRPHNGGSNMRLNLDLPISGHEGAELTVGDVKKSWERGKVAFVYDDCVDHEVKHSGFHDFARLAIGFMHWDAVDALTAMRVKKEL